MNLEQGFTGFTLSVRPSVDRMVSALYFQQHLLDPFHIYTSCQATPAGVCKDFFANFQNVNIWQFFFKFVTLTLSCFYFGSDMNQLYG